MAKTRHRWAPCAKTDFSRRVQRITNAVDDAFAECSQERAVNKASNAFRGAIDAARAMRRILVGSV